MMMAFRKLFRRRQVTVLALRGIAACAVFIAGSPAFANGVYFTLQDPEMAIRVLWYEVLVVIAEWLAFRWLFHLGWGRALALTFGANTLSFVAGLPFSAVVDVSLVWLFLTLPLNVIIEGVFWWRAGRIRMTAGFWMRVCFVNLVTWLAFLPVMEGPYDAASTRSKTGRVRARMRWVGEDINAYIADRGAPPPMLPYRDQLAPETVSRLRDMNGAHLASVHPGNSAMAGLTTPVGYTTSIEPDLFLPGRIPIAYYPDGKGWLLLSPGPDKHFDIVPQDDFVTSTPVETLKVLTHKQYDPTNGISSTGDVWRSNL
jgi:hypothetical protein